MPECRGCYGLDLHGVGDAAALLGPVPDGAPTLTVRLSSPAEEIVSEWVDERSAGFRLQGGGSAVVDRAAGRTLLRMPDAEAVPHEQLVHPFLSTSAAVVNRWHGRDSFHAGAFVVGGGAWAVLGDKGRGKSTLLALSALRGLEVLADDLLVLDDGHALRGPRCIDLRADAAEVIGDAEDLGVVGARHRARLRLGGAPASAPLRGWVFPVWSDQARVEPLAVGQRLGRLLGNLSLRLSPVDPARFLRYASLPCLVLSRPRDWSAAEDGVGVLVETLEAQQLP